MRHEFTRRCVTLGSALAIGLATVSASAQAQQADAEPKQKALVSFKLDFLSRFKNDKQADHAEPVEAKSAVMPASAVEPLPSSSGMTNAVPAKNGEPVQTLTSAAAQGDYPSVLPPSVPPVQLTSGQFPLPAAGQMPFQTAQSPVVIMMPAGWQPDGNYTFAPRTVLSPEVPAEHWPSSQRNPMGDGSRKGLFDWPQIAKKITGSTIGEPEIKPQAPAPDPSTSRALFAAAPATPQAIAAQPQAAPVAPQAVPAVTQQQYSTTPAPQPAAPAPEAQPASKALFAPPPAQPEPQPEESKTRALFSLLSKPMNKPEVAPPSTGSKALFAFGRKRDEAVAAPAPAVVPQYAAETPMSPGPHAPSLTPTTTVEASDPEVQPPAPPTVSNPLPGRLQTVKSDDPKMKWRAKGAPAQVAERAADAPGEARTETVSVQAAEQVESISSRPAMPAAMDQVTAETAPPTISTHLAHRHGQHQPAAQAVNNTAASHERALLGKHFPTKSNEAPRNASEGSDPWRRQAERDALVAAEKKVEQPAANSTAILPNVAALLPALEKRKRPTHHHAKADIATVAATEDVAAQTHSVRRAHDTSARSTDSYYAAPWESEVEAELEAVERRQVGAVSNRRAAIARQTMEGGDESLEQQPRVPFETDELEQEKAAVRRAAKTQRSQAAVRPKSTNPAGTPSNGARMAEQRSQKSCRRLTGQDVKQGFSRPLAVFSEMTKLPSPLKTAADGVERHQQELREEYDGDEEVGQSELYDEQPTRPAPPKRSAAKRQPVHELRQSTAATSSVKKLEERELLASEEDRPASLGQRGGRRQVERTARTSRVQEELTGQDQADTDGVAAEDIADQDVATDVSVEEFEVEQPVRPAVHIRNKHGKRVKIFTGGATADDSSHE